jgi:hypothetical protein
VMIFDLPPLSGEVWKKGGVHVFSYISDPLFGRYDSYGFPTGRN